MTEYNVRGKGKVNLDPSDYKAGGEAKVWIHGDVVYKIYHEIKHMTPEAKLMELRSLNAPHIITPIDIILDNKDRPVGYTMNKADGVPMVTMFTTGYQNNNAIEHAHVVSLIENMKSTTSIIHEQDFLIVDYNELNIIVKKDWVTPQYIDTNAWKTPSFPADAIAPYVRDYSSNEFTTLTDWFSFGIITCYLYTGIHPFRGSHPKYSRTDVEGRMKDHVSIFNSDVKLPRQVRSFNSIPDNYLKWYKVMFEDGKRLAPPDLAGITGSVSVIVTVIKSTNSFEITFIREFEDEIIYHKNVYGKEITRTKKEIWINKTNYRVGSGVDIIITQRNLHTVLAKIKDSKLDMICLDNTIDLNYYKMNASSLMIVANTLFVINEREIIEVGFFDGTGKITASVDSSWGLMSNAEIFNGIIFQHIMGKPYVVIPIPKEGSISSYIELEIPELDGYRIVNGKHENGIVILTGLKNGDYDLFILRFDDNYASYHCRKIDSVDLVSPNFVSLDNGQTIFINAIDEMELFKREPSSTSVIDINDPDIDFTMKLCNNGMQVRFFQGNNLYSIKKK